jgi:methionyl-tRNA formyltransferase
MRLIFMGTPDFSVPALAALMSAGHEIACVYTQPPRAAGRGMKARRSKVHEFALRHDLAVRTPKNFRAEDDIAAFAALNVDAAVVVAYGLILPKVILNAPKLGCFNIHASLLPRWRGAAPIQRAIMAGDEMSGITIMAMDEGLDTGDICWVDPLPIGPDMNAADLHDALSRSGGAAIVEVLGHIASGNLSTRPQPKDGVCYAAKISKAEARIDWARSAQEIHNHIRALSPFPGAWFEARGERIKVLRASLASGEGEPGAVLDEQLTIACGEGAVRLDVVQRAGKKPVKSDDFLRGFTLARGDRLAR